MRKILFILLIVLLLIASGFLIVKGWDIGNINIWGVKQIREENDTIDSKNAQLSTLASTTYANAISGLGISADTLTSTKKEYEDQAALVPNSKSYMQTEKYEIEFLYTKLDGHAHDKNVDMKLETVTSATAGLYDINFTVAGKYAGVTDFIYAVEEDSKLGFKIEDFHMNAIEGGVQATFTCKEIGINIETIDQNGTQQGENGEGTDGQTANETTDQETQNNDTNTTNTTNTQSTENTQNVENTTNTDNNQ